MAAILDDGEAAVGQVPGHALGLLEAAQAYDQLIQDYPDSEVAADALYYSGLSKYALSLRAPGKKEFKDQKESLSELKKTLYASWLEYLDKQKDSFTYLEPIDKNSRKKKKTDSYI